MIEIKIFKLKTENLIDYKLEIHSISHTVEEAKGGN